MRSMTLLILFVVSGLFSCQERNKSKQAPAAKEGINSVRNYVYHDDAGKAVFIQNSGPRGNGYTGLDGQLYFRVIFRTQIKNQTAKPLQLAIGFPGEAIEDPGYPGSRFQVLVPADTVTKAQESEHDYGMNEVGPFLDDHLHQPTSATRVIQAGDSSGFYVLLVSRKADITPGSVLRTGLILKGPNLFYRVSRYASKTGHPLLSEFEIPCGKINLINLRLRE